MFYISNAYRNLISAWLKENMHGGYYYDHGSIIGPDLLTLLCEEDELMFILAHGNKILGKVGI